MKKQKFKLDTKKGQVVYKIELNIYSPESKHYSGISYKEGLTIQELKIVHQTRYKIALNDVWITVLDRQSEDQRKESYKHFLGDISVSIKTKENYFPNGVFSCCWTIEKPEKVVRVMKRKIIETVEREYGFLRDMDLSDKIEDMISSINYTG